jgi:CO/xanthine dehydrogenase Mo-binding subunit
MDCFPKVTGKALYTNDISLPGTFFAGILRSPYPSARILSIDCAEARRHTGVRVVLTAEDIPGNNKYGGIIKDQQHLCDEKVRYVGDPVAVVVGRTQEVVRQALKKIRVNYHELPTVFDPEEAMAPGAPSVHDGGNILHHRKIRKGDVETGFAESDIIIEKTFRSQTMEHAYIEPEAGLAYMDNGQMVLYCCTQAPHYFRGEIASMLGLPLNRVRVIRAVTGGAFGGKGELFGQQYAALAAYITGLPVKCVLTREESVIVTPKRHAFTLYYRFGATKDGRLQAARVTIIGNGGAYASLGPAVLTRSATMAIGPYDCPNVSVDAYEVYTNYPIGGAMRGFGAPQMAPCHEAIMDEIGRKCGLSPVEIRRRNMLRPGSSTVTGQVLEHGVGALGTLEEASRRGWPSSHGGEK